MMLGGCAGLVSTTFAQFSTRKLAKATLSSELVFVSMLAKKSVASVRINIELEINIHQYSVFVIP